MNLGVGSFVKVRLWHSHDKRQSLQQDITDNMLAVMEIKLASGSWVTMEKANDLNCTGNKVKTFQKTPFFRVFRIFVEMTSLTAQ